MRAALAAIAAPVPSRRGFGTDGLGGRLQRGKPEGDDGLRRGVPETESRRQGGPHQRRQRRAPDAPHAEKASPRGDVLVGPDIDVFDAAIDLFDGYKSKEDAAFPRTAVGPDNKYYGFSTNFQAFIVNTKMMPLDKAPQTWMDITKPEYKGKVVIANPAQSGSGYSQMIQILQLYGWDTMDKIIQNATFVTSSRLAYQNIAKGEAPVGLTSEFNILASKLEGFPSIRLPEGWHGAHQRR
jgi:ABC-type Fe3+ transport system substrate-binding protein